MSQEKVREILSHVDMTKIDLSSFKLSEKKFNELSHLYRNRVIVSCASVILRKDDHPAEDVDVSFEMLKRVVENPELYNYSTLYHMEREVVDKAINDITYRRDRNINDIKIKAIERRMKDAYKQMRKTLELALEYDNDFEQEFDEEIVEQCLQLAKHAIERSEQKAAAQKNLEAAQQAIKECEKNIEIIRVEAETAVNALEAQTSTVQTVDVPETAQTCVHSQKEQKVNCTPKKPFWKRIFNKTTA